MKKEDLIKMGLTEEQASKVVEAWDKTLEGYVTYDRFKQVNDQKNDFRDQLKERDGQLDELKKATGSVDELKKSIETLQTDNKTKSEDYEKKIQQMKIEFAIESGLTTAQARNVKAVKALIDLSKITLDGETVKGLEDQIKALTESEDTKFMFGAAENISGANVHQSGDNKDKGIKNPWSKENWNLTKQGELLKTNPELAQQFMNSK